MPSARNTSLGVAGALVIGALVGNISPSILNSAKVPAGSTVTTGNIVLATANRANSTVNNNPSIVVDSGAVDTFPTSGGAGIPGGGYRLAASGSTMLRADILVPSTYQSGAVLDGIRTECGNTGVSNTGSIVVNRKATKMAITSGTNLRNGIVFSTGSYTIANTGGVIQTKLTAGTYISVVTNAKAIGSVGQDCIVRPIVHEKYGR